MWCRRVIVRAIARRNMLVIWLDSVYISGLGLTSNRLSSTNIYTVNTSTKFTFMLPCIVTDFFLNNQPDAPII